MPQAKQPSAPQNPAPLSEEEERFIVSVVHGYYGEDAVIRNWGPDPRQLLLHVETDRDVGLERWECLGTLECEIKRDRILLDVSRRGERLRGNAKLAHRQGVVLGSDATPMS